MYRALTLLSLLFATMLASAQAIPRRETVPSEKAALEAQKAKIQSLKAKLRSDAKADKAQDKAALKAEKAKLEVMKAAQKREK